MAFTIHSHKCPEGEPGPSVIRPRAVANYLGFVRGFGWYLDLSWPDDPDRTEDIDSVRVRFCPWCGMNLADVQPAARPARLCRLCAGTGYMDPTVNGWENRPCECELGQSISRKDREAGERAEAPVMPAPSSGKPIATTATARAT